MEIEKLYTSRVMRQLEGAPWLTRFDNNQMREEDWDNSKLRVLICFLSPGVTRAVSNTYTALDGIIRQISPDIFVDYAYFPTKNDIPIYKKNDIPFWFGNVSRRSALEYDLIIISSSILVEFINIFSALDSIGIPRWHKDRIDRSDIPLIMAGGIPIADHDAMGGNSGLVDLVYVGYAEGNLAKILLPMMEMKSAGENLNANKKKLIKKFVSELGNIYYPNGYEVVYEGEFIKKIRTKYDWVPEKVRFHHEHEIDKYPAFERKILNPDNSNATGSDLLVSAGCSGVVCAFCHPADTLISTNVGLKRIDEVCPGEKVVTQSGDLNEVLRCYELGKKNLLEIELKDGYNLKATECHFVAVLDGMRIKWIQAKDLSVGDHLIVYRGTNFSGSYGLSKRECEFIGRMVGDGCWNTKVSLFSNVDEQENCERLLQDIGLKYQIRIKELCTVEYILSKSIKKRFGFAVYNKDGKILPQVVYKMSREEVLSFFKGWVEADGVIANNSLSVSNKNKSLLSKLQIILLGAGIVSRMERLEIKCKEVGRKATIQVLYRLHVEESTSNKILSENGFQVCGKEYSNLTKPSSQIEREMVIQSLKNKNKISYIRHSSLTFEIIKRTDIDNELYNLIRKDRIAFYPVSEIRVAGREKVYDLVVENEHNFIANGILSHNGMEGIACGGWRERSLEKMTESMDECKRYTASNRIGFYSFNFNYYYRFIDIIYEATKRFSSLSLINLRTDMIGAAPEYFKACLALGIRRLSMPIEGFGERVRNKILNKSLSFEQIKTAFKLAFEAGLMEIKVGMILTGHETAEDLEIAAQEFEELYRMKEEAQTGAGIRANITPLVYYPHTALGWKKQVTSMISLNQAKQMKPLLDRLRGKVRFKFNGQNFGTFIEQATLNLGRLGTPIWEKIADTGYNYYASPAKEVIQMILTEIKDRGLSLQKFLDEKSYDYIFPMDMVPKKDERFNKIMFDSAGVKELYPCTKTVIREDPKCLSCGYCETKEQKDSILKREIFNKHTCVDIQEELFKNKAQGATRIGFRVTSKYSMVGKEALAFSIASQFLRESDELFEKYHSSHNISNSPMLRGNLWDWMSGVYYFDIHWKVREVDVDWGYLARRVNAKMFSTEVFSISPVEVRERQSENIQVISIMEIVGVSIGQVREWVKNQKDVVKVGAKGRVTGNEVLLEDRELPYCEVELAQTKTAVRMALIHPVWMNPYLYVATNGRFSYKKVMEMCDVLIAGYFGEKVGFCKCGKGTRISELSRKEAPLCSSCLAKTYLVRSDFT